MFNYNLIIYSIVVMSRKMNLKNVFQDYILYSIFYKNLKEKGYKVNIYSLKQKSTVFLFFSFS